MKRIHVIGRKNAGKTTLVCDLVGVLAGRGMAVATIKHTHHRHELDTPGKDSHRHAEAGAAAVGILSPGTSAIFWPARGDRSEADRYERFDALMRGFDLVIVEGDVGTAAPKIEVWRAEVGDPPYALAGADGTGVAGVHAIVTDDELAGDIETWPRTDLDRLADQLTDWLGS